MKRKELIKLFQDNGWWIAREGSDHTIFTDGKAIESIPRHTEVNEYLSKDIIRRRGLKK
jgi:predicted RNA binding protein YcfA (HicA-like mRNA interferase family)